MLYLFYYLFHFYLSISLVKSRTMNRGETLLNDWNFSFNNSKPIPVSVPSCWEEFGIPFWKTGPAVYSKDINISRTTESSYLLRFEGVSYHSKIYVNSRLVFLHKGNFDIFEVDVTNHVVDGKNSFHVEVEKPASNIDGPGSDFYPGKFPIDETLSGFLPYVWGFMCGGLIRPVTLIEFHTQKEYIDYTSVLALSSSEGSFSLDFEVVTNSSSLKNINTNYVVIQILDSESKCVFHQKYELETKKFHMSGKLNNKVIVWEPSNPYLYTLIIELEGSDIYSQKLGFRTVESNGSVINLNGIPFYPRFLLSWGWGGLINRESNGIFPDLPPDEIRRIFKEYKSMGFNGVKLCLWVASQTYYEIAQEEGILIWQEFPIWKNRQTEYFETQSMIEFPRILRTIGKYISSSIVIIDLGCEISGINEQYLDHLYGLIYSMVGKSNKSILLGSNSGGGEVYGEKTIGVKTEFYDNHFYADLQFLRGLFDRFEPQKWRENKPWMMGEFCDKDTIRDLNSPKYFSPSLPFWFQNNSLVNPQGSRWDMSVAGEEVRMKELGIWNHLEEYVLSSLQQAMFHRKVTLERVRKQRHLSGIVVTVEVDNPISKSGVFDDFYQRKFDGDEMKCVNDDTVLLIGFDRQREWICGGDRATYFDEMNVFSGDVIRLFLIISHYGREEGEMKYSWKFEDEDGNNIYSSEGSNTTRVFRGEVNLFCSIEMISPSVVSPKLFWFSVLGKLGEKIVTNKWSFWVFPKLDWKNILPFSIIDPLEVIVPEIVEVIDGKTDINSKYTKNRVSVTSLWDERAKDFVFSEGGTVILLQRAKDNYNYYFDSNEFQFSVQQVPFWRESFHKLHKDIIWGDFPIDSFGSQFYPIASDLSLKVVDEKRRCRNVHERIDARKFDLSGYLYVCEFENIGGKLVLTTLHVEGKLGDEPSNIAMNYAGLYLLYSMIHQLQQIM